MLKRKNNPKPIKTRKTSKSHENRNKREKMNGFVENNRSKNKEDFKSKNSNNRQKRLDNWLKSWLNKDGQKKTNKTYKMQ